MSFQPRIAIVGAGPSGLALSLLLQKHGIQPTIYELRSPMSAQELAKPSGMLDLHEESGLKVMRECGLWEAFQAAVGDCSEACRVMDSRANLLHSDEGGASSRPEIPRHSLTDLLLKKVGLDKVKWNHKVTAVHEARNTTTGATEITLDLGPHGTATHDYVVGADGAWSRVRNLLTDVKPFYSNSQFIVATLRNATADFPRLLELTGSGSLMALGGGNGMLTHRGPQDSIRLYAAVSTPHEHWDKAAGVEGKTAVEVKTTLLGDDTIFGKWAPPLQDLLASVYDEDTKDNPGKPAEIWPMYMLPVGNSWEHHTGATLIGDSSHLMTPFAGEGVNLALWDSLDLSQALGGVPKAADAAAWQAAIEPRIRDFEKTMLSRAQEKAEETVQNKDMMLSEHGGQALADIFKTVYDRGEGET